MNTCKWIYLTGDDLLMMPPNDRLRAQRKLRTYPGCRLLCEHDPEYQDIFEEFTRLPEDGSMSSLANIAPFMQPTGINPSFYVSTCGSLRPEFVKQMSLTTSSIASMKLYANRIKLR
jgi:hypothetical protein